MTKGPSEAICASHIFVHIPIPVHELVVVPLGRPGLEAVAARLGVLLAAETGVRREFLVRLLPTPIPASSLDLDFSYPLSTQCYDKCVPIAQAFW